MITVISDRNEEYMPEITEFLERLQNFELPVKSVGMVALFNENAGDYHNAAAYFNANTYDVATMSSVFLLDATLKNFETNREPEEFDEDYDENN